MDTRVLIIDDDDFSRESMAGLIEFYRQVASIILYHHERYDGTGYPGRLAGRAIPRGARPLAIVHALEAMAAKRSYRRPFTIEQALRVLQQGARSQRDRAMVTAWVELVRQGRVSVPPVALGRTVRSSTGKRGFGTIQYSRKRLVRGEAGRA